MKRHGLLVLLALLLAAPPAFSQASSLANCKYYTKTQQDYEQGLPYCADAIKEFPDDPEARFWGAVCLAEMGQLAEAADSFNWLIERKGSKDKNVAKHAKMAEKQVAAYYGKFWNKGLELIQAEDTGAARDEFKKATEINPMKSDAFLNLGYTQMQLDDVDGAMQSFSRAVEIDPENKQARVFYWSALDEKLKQLRTDAEPDTAAIADISAKLRETLTKVLELDPAEVDAHLEMADLDLAAGDTDAGLGHVRRAIEIAPESVVNLANIGIQFYQNNQYDAAVSALSMVLEYVKDPEDEIWEKCVWVLGLSYYELEQWEPALAQFQKMLERDPDNMEVLPKAGLAARKAGQKDLGDQYLIHWEELKEAQVIGG